MQLFGIKHYFYNRITRQVLHHTHVYIYGIAEIAFPLQVFEGKVELVTARFEAIEVPLYLIVSRLDDLKQPVDAVFHQQVLLEAGRYTAVVPVLPGVVVRHTDEILKHLLSKVPQIADKISFLRGKTCWRIALYLADEFAFATSIRHPELEQIDLKRLTASSTQAQQLHGKREEICRRLMPYESSAVAAGVIQSLETVFSYMRPLPTVDSCHSGRTDRMIGHYALLVPQSKVEKMGMILQKARNELHPKGIHLELSGPWPPYLFMD